MKRDGAGASSNGGITQHSGSQSPTGEVQSSNPSPRGHAQRGSQPRGINQQQWNSFRNRNGGSHSRGDGFSSHNYGVRRDHDRGNPDWNAHRNVNAYMQPQRLVPTFVMPPPPPLPMSTSFIPHPQVWPFGGPMGYHDFQSSMYYGIGPPPDSIRALPFPAPLPPHPALFPPPPDLQLHSKILNQINYYFSSENLIKDTFLRQHMDKQGWVPIKLIAGFNKVSQLTDNIQAILDSVRSSTVIEVQGDKVRRRNDWRRWLMPPSVQFPNVSGPQSHLGNSSQEMLSNLVQSISLDKSSGNNNVGSQEDANAETLLCGSTYLDLSTQSQQSISEETEQVGVGGGLDHPASARNSK